MGRLLELAETNGGQGHWYRKAHGTGRDQWGAGTGTGRLLELAETNEGQGHWYGEAPGTSRDQWGAGTLVEGGVYRRGGGRGGECLGVKFDKGGGNQ